MGQTDYEVLQLASLIYPLLGELAELGDHDARLKRAMCLASAADVATPDALPMILKRAREWTRGPNTSAPKALQSIFSQIKITSEPKAKFLQPGKLDLRRLFPSDVMPDPGEIKQARVRTAIEVSKVFKRQDLSFAALLTQLGTVLEVNTWGVPSGFAEAASLYDEIRSVAAIAAALFRYEDSGEGRRTGGEFQLLVGDLSGIQRYIFAVANLGVGGVAKRLRARSFLLAITTVALAHKIVSDLGLSVYNILIQSGGTFQILLPNTERSCSLVDGLRKAVNKELYDLYGAELAFNLAATRLSGHQLAEYAKVTAEAFTRLRVEKTRPLHSVVQDSQGWCEDAFILDAHHVSDQGYCSSCKRLPAETSIVKMQGPEEVWVCNICQNDINVGRWFPSTKYLFVYDGEPPQAYEVVAPKFAADKNRVTPVDFSFLKEASLLERINDAIVHHRYMHAKQLLDQLAHSTCDPTRETMARRAANVVELVDKWDKMRYNDARCNAPAIIKDLQRYPNCMDVQMLVERWEANLRLLCRDSAEGGFQRLCDILSNARRRFDEGNYVDAVGRVRRLYEGVLYLALAAHGVNPQNPRQSTTAEHGVLNYTRPLSVVEAKDFCCLFNPRVQVFLTSRSAELDNCRIDDVAEEIVKLRNSSVVGHGQEQVTQAKAATSLKLGAVLLKGFAEMYRDRWQLTDQNNAFPAGKSRHPLCVPAQHLIAKKDSPSSRRTPHTAPMCAKYKEVALCLLG